MCILAFYFLIWDILAQNRSKGKGRHLYAPNHREHVDIRTWHKARQEITCKMVASSFSPHILKARTWISPSTNDLHHLLPPHRYVRKPFSQNTSMKLNSRLFFFFDSTFFISNSSASPYMCKFSYPVGNDLSWGIRKLTEAHCQELKYECSQKQKNKSNQ